MLWHCCISMSQAHFLSLNSRGCAKRRIPSAVPILHSAFAVHPRCVLFYFAHHMTRPSTCQISKAGGQDDRSVAGLGRYSVSSLCTQPLTIVIILVAFICRSREGGKERLNTLAVHILLPSPYTSFGRFSLFLI